MDNSRITMYVDGACSGNPGRGGYAVILQQGEYQKEISGYSNHTTNNQMELTAVIVGIKALKRPCTVDVYCDSAYVVDAFQKGYIDMWKRNGWRKSNKKSVLNANLWMELLDAMEIHHVKFHKVEGHGDDMLNNRCDYLAKRAIINSG